MNENLKFNKMVHRLLETVKDTVQGDLTISSRSGVIKIDEKTIERALVIINNAIDVTYSRSARALDREFADIVKSVSASQEVKKNT